MMANNNLDNFITEEAEVELESDNSDENNRETF